MEVHHVNSDATDACLGNLEAVTPEENRAAALTMPRERARWSIEGRLPATDTWTKYSTPAAAAAAHGRGLLTRKAILAACDAYVAGGADPQVAGGADAQVAVAAELVLGRQWRWAPRGFFPNETWRRAVHGGQLTNIECSDRNRFRCSSEGTPFAVDVVGAAWYVRFT